MKDHYIIKFELEGESFRTAARVNSALGAHFCRFMQKPPSGNQDGYAAPDSMYLSLEYVLGPELLQNGHLTEVKYRDQNSACDRVWKGKVSFMRIPEGGAAPAEPDKKVGPPFTGTLAALNPRSQSETTPIPPYTITLGDWFRILAEGGRPGFAIVVSHPDEKSRYSVSKALKAAASNLGDGKYLYVNTTEEKVSLEHLKAVITNEEMAVRDGRTVKIEPTPSAIIIATDRPEEYTERRFLQYSRLAE